MGFIGGLFAGLFGIFGNLFGKKEEFFLDLDNAKGEGKTETAPAKKAEVKVAPASAPATIPAETKAKKTEPKKEAAPKAKKVEKAAPATTPVAKAKPATTPVVPANVIANTAPRRRPGPSLNQFKDMARQMNVRR
ncbi:MAG: hypothetical protein ACRC2J_14715 [Microcoleaceae cyanobacterium]